MLKPSLLSGAVVVVLTGVLGYNNVYQPTQVQLRKIREERAAHEQAQALREQLVPVIRRYEQFSQRLPTAADTEWFVNQVNQLAERTRVRVVALTPQKPKQLNGLTQLSLTLQCTGSYHLLGQFLSAVESAPTFIRVDQLELSHDEKDGDMAQAHLILSTFSAPGVAAMVSGAVTTPSS